MIKKNSSLFGVNPKKKKSAITDYLLSTIMWLNIKMKPAFIATITKITIFILVEICRI